jgi:hypothetical protein
MTVDEIDALKIITKHVRELLLAKVGGDPAKLPTDFVTAVNTVAKMTPPPASATKDKVDALEQAIAPLLNQTPGSTRGT